MFPGASNSGGCSLSGCARDVRLHESIQIGSAATAPVSFAPSGFFSSSPVQTRR